MIDLVNSVIRHFQSVTIASNPKGVFVGDIARLAGPVNLSHFFFISRSRIWSFLRPLPRALRGLIVISLTLLEPVFFVINVSLFLLKIKILKPDSIVCCNGGYPASRAVLAMVIAAKILKVPTALSIVSMPIPRSNYFKPIERVRDWLVWHSLDAVIVNAKAIENALCKFRDMPVDLCHVVYNGLEDIPSINIDKKENRFHIGYVARMDASKGVFYLLDAFTELLKEYPEMHLILAGEGEASPELLRRIHTRGLQNHVSMLGHYSDDLNALLSTFDVYIFPSLWEGLPYSIIEAMRSGCAIVTTGVGGIPEIVCHGQEGIIIKTHSEKAISEAIKQLMNDSSLRQTLRNNARMKYEADLTLDKMHVALSNIVMGIN